MLSVLFVLDSVVASATSFVIIVEHVCADVRDDVIVVDCDSHFDIDVDDGNCIIGSTVATAASTVDADFDVVVSPRQTLHTNSQC